MKLLIVGLFLLGLSQVQAQEKPSYSLGIGVVTALQNLNKDFGNTAQYRLELTLPYYINMEVITQLSYASWQVKGYDLKHLSALAGLRQYFNTSWGLALDLGLTLHLLQGDGPKALLLTDKESDFGYEIGAQLFKIKVRNHEITFRIKGTQLWTKPNNSFFLSNYLSWGMSW